MSKYTLNGESPRGFAAIKDPDRRSEIARMGGTRAWELGRANKWTSETAQVAGRKGGSVSHRSRPYPRTCGDCGVIESASVPFVGAYCKCRPCFNAYQRASRKRRKRQHKP